MSNCEILELKAQALKTYSDDDFAKALAVIKTLLDYTPSDALKMIDFWVVRGILTSEERESLHLYYGIL
jgi:hypothetical protein